MHHLVIWGPLGPLSPRVQESSLYPHHTEDKALGHKTSRLATLHPSGLQQENSTGKEDSAGIIFQLNGNTVVNENNKTSASVKLTF